MKIGIFYPWINWCGGGEFVAIQMIKTLKAEGHKIILLSDNKLNNKRILELYNEKVIVDKQIVFPFLSVIPIVGTHNIYNNIIKSMVIKYKSDLVIDAASATILPKMDIVYFSLSPKIFSKQFGRKSDYRRFLYLPYYNSIENKLHTDKLIISNSGFTARIIKDVYNVDPLILYPPVNQDNLQQDSPDNRINQVITISRISKEKRLNIIPYIAQYTQHIRFIIVGLLDQKEEYLSLIKLIKKLNVSNRVKILYTLHSKGGISRKKLTQLLLKSKVYLHTSVDEPFGISILEGMAAGCIPIVHDSGGPKEFVPQDLMYRSIEDAVYKIEKAIDLWKPSISKEMNKIAKKFNKKEFSKKFLKIINDYIS